MQRQWKGRKIRPYRPWVGRKWARLVKLALLLTLAVALLFSGVHHGRRWQRQAADGPIPESVAGPAEPIDGDSLWVGDTEVRLEGIDAPEWKQECKRDGEAWSCGRAARDALAGMIAGDDVTCAISKRDVYGRLLAHCRAGGRDLNAQMVSSGMALAYGGYGSEQASARTGKRGLWAGDFEEPRDWRKAHDR